MKKTKKIKEEKITTGFKGFDENLKCRGLQFEIDEEYEIKEKPEVCKKGFHFCEHPLNVFSYYPPNKSRYAEVVGFGETSTDVSDSKVAVSKIKIGAEISLKKLIESSIKFTFSKVKWTKENTSNGYQSGAISNGDQSGAISNGIYSGATSNGDQSGAISNGIYSGATSNGYQSGAISNGYQSGATSNGIYSGAISNGRCSGATSNGRYSGATSKKGNVATAIGYKAKAKGEVGAWLSITECVINPKTNLDEIIDVKVFFVDGDSVKENTFYILENGKLQLA